MLERLERNDVEVANFKTLPEGAYKVNIIGAKVESFSNGGQGIKLQFEISEGEYKGFFKEQYQNSTFENKTYKGVITLFVPDKNNQYYEQQRKRFWRNITAIEDLNNGFKFADLEKVAQFKDKQAIILMVNREYDYNGKQGVSVQPNGFIYKSAFDDKSYLETIEYLNSKITSATTAPTQDLNGFTEADIEQDDLPF